MGLVRRALRGEERAVGLPSIASIEDLYQIVGGEKVSIHNAGTEERALQHDVIYRAVNKLSGIVGSLPWKAMNGTREVGSPLLDGRPSVDMRAIAWKRAVTASMLLQGNAAALVSSPDGGRTVERLELLDWSRVDWTTQRGWTLDSKEIALWPVGPLWHVPLQTLPGSPVGLNPIEYARRTTFSGLVAKEFGNNFFKDGAHPTAIISPKKDPGPEGSERLKKKIRRAVSGTDREPLVMPADTGYHQLQVNPSDSMFIELMQFTGGQLAGFFGLEPYDVGLPIQGSSLEYFNRNNRQQDLLQNAVDPVLEPLEEALTELHPNQVEIVVVREGILRSDLSGRYDSYVKSAEYERVTGVPILTNDEIRELENRGPLDPDDFSAPGGDNEPT
jgi:HK97 family phage portal protein